MKKLLIAFLTFIMLLCTIGLVACSKDDDGLNDFDYQIDFNNEYIITGYKGSDEEVVIPSTIKGKPVTSIGSSAFENCGSLTSIEIPTGVTNIGNYAFSNCYSLTSVEIPIGVTTIGDYAFCACTSLTSIEIPNSVTSIGVRTFAKCYLLECVKFEENSRLTSIGSSAFYLCRSLSNIEIPNSVISIGHSSFDGCDNLQYTIESNLTYLGNNTNKYVGLLCVNSKAMTSVTINSKCKVIGDDAFCACTSLTSIEIPNSVTSIGVRTFAECYLLECVKFEENSRLTSIGAFAFRGCSSLTSIEIPNGVTTIGDYAFCACTSLTSIEIPNSVTNIGTWVFDNCDNLQYNVEDDLKYLGNNVNKYLCLVDITSDCITYANINDNCKIIGNCAFYDCKLLESVEIPNSVISIGDYAFWECRALTMVNYIGSIEEWVQIEFYENSSNPVCHAKNLYINGELLTEVKLTSVNKISANAFRGCDSIRDVVIGASVTSIGEYAFSWCDSLTRVIISRSVTKIENYAFKDCDSLTIYCEIESEPSDWDGLWNCVIKPVMWGYKGNN